MTPRNSFERTLPNANAAMIMRGPAGAVRLPARVAVSRPIPRLVRRSLLFFVATMPFDQIILPWFPGFLGPAKISGLVFFGCCLWYPKTCFRRAPPAVLWFAGYLAVVALLGMFIPAELRPQLRVRFLTMAQLVLFFWVGSSASPGHPTGEAEPCHVWRGRDRACRRNIVATSGFCGLESHRRVLGRHENDRARLQPEHPGEPDGPGRRHADRDAARQHKTPEREDVAALRHGRASSSRYGRDQLPRRADVVCTRDVAVSRPHGSFAAANRGSCAGHLCADRIGRHCCERPRLAGTMDADRSAGADRRARLIWIQGVAMFLERPILGWGPVDFLYELGSRLNLPYRDPHNGILWLLLEVGIVGALFFFAGFYLCARASWKSRTGPEGILPLALMVMAAAMNFGGSDISRKPMWFVLAIALASPVISAKWQRAMSSGNRAVRGGL